jgi:peroxiredoxin
MNARLARNSKLWIALVSLLIVVSGCSEGPQNNTSSLDALVGGRDRKSAPAIEEGNAASPAQLAPVDFKDHVQSNAEVPAGLEGLVFLDTAGRRVALSSYLGKKNIVLVFTEGFSGMLCPFCKTQTSRLIENYEKFRALDAEVLVVYPGTREHVGEFIEAAKKTEKRQIDEVPFPIVLDEDMTAVDFFSIRSNLAHPSTYIIDKKGNVRLAYVGKDMSADRPSVGAILNEIKASNN